MTPAERAEFRQSPEYREAFTTWISRAAAIEAFEGGDNDEFHEALEAFRARRVNVT